MFILVRNHYTYYNLPYVGNGMETIKHLLYFDYIYKILVCMCDLRACFDYVHHHVTCKQNNQLVATYIIGDWVGVLRGLTGDGEGNITPLAKPRWGWYLKDRLAIQRHNFRKLGH